MSYQVSTTYLKLFAMDPEFQALQVQAPTLFEELDLEADYFSAELLETMFTEFNNRGLDSWILKFAPYYSTASHGALGFAALSSPSLGQALKTICEFTQIRASNVLGRLDDDGKTTRFILEENMATSLAHRWLLEAVVYTTLELIKQILIRPLDERLSVQFTWPATSYAAKLEALYGVQCRYGQKRTALSLPSEWCSINAPMGDQKTYQSNVQKCRELMLSIEQQHNPVIHLKNTLAHYFGGRLAGEHTAEHCPSLALVAASLNRSERTLARQLEQQQSSYKQELTLARQTMAKHLLSESHLKVADIADVLAYKDTANFVRAFKTWFDMPPSQWRRHQYDKRSI